MANNDIDDTKKYKVTKQSKVGRILNWTNLCNVLTVSVVLGLAGVVVKEVKNYMELQNYAYDSSYDLYSKQIEDMEQIDLSSSLEDDLNSMQMMQEAIDAYKNNDSIISKEDALKILESQKTNFENTALNIAKKWCSNEWGGNELDYKIVSEGSNMPGWTAVNSKLGNHDFPNGNIVDFLNSIGQLQGYSSEMIEQTSNSDAFVNTCDTVSKYSGIVAADIAKSQKSK